MNFDDKTLDSFYRITRVSQINATQQPSVGHYGLANSRNTPDSFECNAKVMVWSAGPDKMIDANTKANEGVNRDNVLSWKE
jgi:hypothetical protein